MLKRLLRNLAVGITMAVVAPAAKLPTEAQQLAAMQKVEKQWAAKLGVILPVKFAIKTEAEIIAEWVEIGHLPMGPIYGLSWPADEKGESVNIWVMRLQDYPEWADPKKIQRDQIDTVVHELVHVLYHSWDQETVTARLADLFIKGKIDR